MPSPTRARPRRLALAALAPALLALACGRESPTGPPDELTALPRALTAAERQTIAAGNDFSIALFREVNARRAGENVFISPFSAAMALGMLLNGAEGTTETEMRATLGVAGRSAQEINESWEGLTALLLSLDPSVNVGIANAIFHRNSFPVESAFLDVNRDHFDAEVRALDFTDEPATLAAVNGWAKERTNGRIERVLEQVTADNVMFLMNALYFKGAWRTQFDPAQTRPLPFTRADGSRAEVPTMQLAKAPVKLGHAADGTQVGELPYGNGAYAMTILLPAPGRSADDLVASLTPATWDAMLGTLHDARIEVQLPKFRLSYEDYWNDVLTAMGMGSAFVPGTADFRGISRDGGLFVSFVKQNTFVEVNEEGTEAAAVTTIGVDVVSAPPSLRVDRPFVFAIRERLSGTILFVGKVATP